MENSSCRPWGIIIVVDRTTVELDGNAGRGRRLPAGIQSGEAAQPAGLREPGGFCGAELSIPSSGRASPSLRWGWTNNKQKHKLNHVPGLIPILYRMREGEKIPPPLTLEISERS